MMTTNNCTESGYNLGGFNVSDADLQIYIWVVYCALCQAMNTFGIVTNIINIVCFIKQSFNESINISLLGLSISDLAGLITMAMTCIFISPALAAKDVPFDSYDFGYLVSGMPHFALGRVSSCITAVITLERCLSIAVPLHLKSIVTPRRTASIIAFIFVAVTCSSAPVFAVNSLGITFSTARNKTILGLIYHPDREQVEQITFSVNFVIHLCVFVIIILCTIILSLQLRRNTQWRKQTVTTKLSVKLSNRDKKIANMVMLISTLYIVCFVPGTTFMVVIAFEPSFFINGKYVHVSECIYGCTYLMESVNASLSIFIYHSMSSKYRDVLRKLFRSGNHHF